MPASVVVDFQVAGISKVQQAFATVEKASIKADKARTQAEKTGSKEREQILVKETREKERELQKLGREADKWRKEEIRGAEKAERAKIIEVERSTRMMSQIRERSATMAGQIARREADAEIREIKRVAEARGRFRKAIGSAGVNSVKGMAGTAIGMAGGALALGGGFAIADAVSGYRSADRAAVMTSNAGYIPGQTPRVDPKIIMAQASAIAIKTGLDKTDVIGGLGTYADRSSDLAGGMRNLDFFSKLSKGSGANFGEVMDAAGMMKAQNANLSDTEMQNMMRGIVGQGKLGAVSFKELAHSAAVTTSTSGMYAGNQAENQRKLLGLQQIAVKTAGSSDDAATVVSRFGSDIMAHTPLLKKHGVTATDSQGQLLDAGTILGQMFDKSGGNLNTMHEMGGLGKESVKLAEALAPVYRLAEATKKGSGGAAVTAEVSKYEKAGYSQEDIDKDFSEVMKTSTERMDLATTQIKEILETKLAPYLERFAAALPGLMPKIEHLIDAFDTLAKMFLDNPIKGVGAVIAAKLTADVGKAALGELLKNIIAQAAGGKTGSALVEAALGTGTAAGAGSSAGGGVVAALGGAAGVAGAAGLTAVLGGALYGTYMQNDTKQNAKDAEAMRRSNPAEYARQASAREQQNNTLDKGSREYAANLAFIHGSGGSGGFGKVSAGDQSIINTSNDRGGLTDSALRKMQFGDASSKQKLNVDQQELTRQLSAALGGAVHNQKGSVNDSSRNDSLATRARGGAQ